MRAASRRRIRAIRTCRRARDVRTGSTVSSPPERPVCTSFGLTRLSTDSSDVGRPHPLRPIPYVCGSDCVTETTRDTRTPIGHTLPSRFARRRGRLAHPSHALASTPPARSRGARHHTCVGFESGCLCCHSATVRLGAAYDWSAPNRLGRTSALPDLNSVRRSCSARSRSPARDCD